MSEVTRNCRTAPERLLFRWTKAVYKFALFRAYHRGGQKNYIIFVVGGKWNIGIILTCLIILNTNFLSPRWRLIWSGWAELSKLSLSVIKVLNVYLASEGCFNRVYTIDKIRQDVSLSYIHKVYTIEQIRQDV